MQRDRIGRNSALNDFLKGFFQHVETGDAEYAVDITADNDFEDDRRSFGDHYLVTEFFRLNFKIADRAGAAIFTVQTKLIVMRATGFYVFETMRQKQNS